MDTTAIALSDNEKSAITLVHRRGVLLTSQIEDRTSHDILGALIPGRGLFNRLIKKGLAYETEEPVLEDGFQFTTSIELTDQGEALARTIAQQGY